MNKLILVLFVAISSTIQAQDYPFKSEVVQQEGMSALDIYLKSKEWYAKTFNSAQDVIQMDERGETLIAKGITKVDYSSMVMGKEYITPMNIYFTLTSRFKDGRFKYDIIISSVSSETAPVKYPYSLYVNAKTEEGVKEMFQQFNLKASKKTIEKSIIANTDFCNAVDNKMNELIDSLKSYIASTTQAGDDW
nr:DUF4468 domain-containing protein [uncultured Carboxylicivirga sp.]